MNYFAYGSNMSLKRLSNRITGCRILGTYILNHHELRFHKSSNWDGSAKCDVYYTGKTGSSVFGVLYSINEEAKCILDEIEGLGKGYEEKKVQLFSVEDQSEETALTYYATEVDPSLLPYSWYVRHVLTGAREAGFPGEYLEEIERVKTVNDSDRKREEKELAIYQDVLYNGTCMIEENAQAENHR